jgi:heme/copper-type cytochrome/quinol oxidase subunit 3
MPRPLGGHAAGKEPSPESRANIEARSKNASAKPQARGRVPGNQGIWVGICCEYVEFLVLFTVYFVARAHFPESSLHGFVAIVPLTIILTHFFGDAFLRLVTL